jgi:serine protease
VNVRVNVVAPPANLPPVVSATLLTAPDYDNNTRYNWATPLGLSGTATDPEGNNPLSYVWKATSFTPNTRTVFRSNVQIGTGPTLSWTPMDTPSLFGTAANFGETACQDGQTVRLTLEVTDSLGNKGTAAVREFTVVRCIIL